MRLGVLDSAFASTPLDAMLDQFAALGLQAVEVGAGNYPGDAHCDVQGLLASKVARQRYCDAFRRRGLAISALSCHGNPLHPDTAIATKHDLVYRDAVRLAAELGVGVVNVFSGCPGDGPQARHPNWVTSRWPEEYIDILTWQWDQAAVPYWTDAAAFAEGHGIRLGFEMHPGFLVYSPRTMLDLRSRVGPAVCVNLDPSHLIWQGIDSVVAIRDLADLIVHVHVKDTRVDHTLVARWGVLDLDRSTIPATRPWQFRAAGRGQDSAFWSRFVRALAEVGYTGVLSIEHEDMTMSPPEGIAVAIATLRSALASEEAE